MNESSNKGADSMSAEKLQLFVVGLSGMDPKEARKLKVLYVKNAVTEYKALQRGNRASKIAMAFFFLIPIFWPFLIAGLRSMKVAEQALLERIQNAVEVWKEDLEGVDLGLDAPHQPWG